MSQSATTPASSWLGAFAAEAEATDRLADDADHLGWLAAGLVGEVGGILAELKKRRRELNAYPAYRGRLVEEFGDALWYFVRIATLAAPDVLHSPLVRDEAPGLGGVTRSQGVDAALALGGAAGAIGDMVRARPEVPDAANARAAVMRVWSALVAVADNTGVSLEDAARQNRIKTRGRWPVDRTYGALFDDGCPEHEQLPRKLDVEFRAREVARGRGYVVLRCNGLNFGDRLTDNIEDPDGYRYHDVFHFAHVVHVGWSPVVRALLRCKRKSDPAVDEAQDGARAVIIEEAVTATIFSRAKQLNFFDGIDHVDFDLLKQIAEYVAGYEVARVPLWQWEEAILTGYKLFRFLRANRGGRVLLDLPARRLEYLSPG